MKRRAPSFSLQTLPQGRGPPRPALRGAAHPRTTSCPGIRTPGARSEQLAGDAHLDPRAAAPAPRRPTGARGGSVRTRGGRGGAGLGGSSPPSSPPRAPRPRPLGSAPSALSPPPRSLYSRPSSLLLPLPPATLLPPPDQPSTPPPSCPPSPPPSPLSPPPGRGGAASARAPAGGGRGRGEDGPTAGQVCGAGEGGGGAGGGRSVSSWRLRSPPAPAPAQRATPESPGDAGRARSAGSTRTDAPSHCRGRGPAHPGGCHSQAFSCRVPSAEEPFSRLCRPPADAGTGVIGAAGAWVTP